MKKYIFFIMVFLFFGITIVRAQKMTVKDSDGHVLMEVIDEGSKGSIMIPDTSVALSSETNKLYNLSGTLMWNGTALGTAGSAGGWTDGGSSVTLSTSSDLVGVGKTPVAKLDIDGDTNVDGLYKIDGATFLSFYGNPCYSTFIGVNTGHGTFGYNNTHVGYEAGKLDNGNGNTLIGYRAGRTTQGSQSNTFVGFMAGDQNSTGSSNAFFGWRAGEKSTTGNNNAFFGVAAGNSNTTGRNNAFFGNSSGNKNYNGMYNTFIGDAAGSINTNGSNNVFIGYKAGTGNLLQSGNIYIGYQAGKSAEATFNTFLGYNAGENTTSGGTNTFIGYQTGRLNETGQGNVFLGNNAGYAETGSSKLYIANTNDPSPLIWGDFNSDSLVVNGRLTVTSFLDLPNGATDGYVLTSDASGVGTWQAATGGGDSDWTISGSDMYSAVSGNVGIGDNTPTHKLDVAGKIGINDTQVLYLPGGNFTGTLIVGTGGGSLSHSSDDQGRYNTGVGIGALNANTTGWNNMASGYRALYSNSTGKNNTASGMDALFSNTEGNSNTASGKTALYYNTTGDENTASGYRALHDNTTGSYNTASGRSALFYNTTGNNNTGIGDDANLYNQTGSNNTIIGYEAGRGPSAHNKSGNVFIGYQAGYNETGDNKLYIENSNSSTPLIGGDFSADELYLNGKVGIGTMNPNSKLDVNGTAEMTGFKLTTGISDGYVLTSDASGVGTWQVASGGGDSDWTISGSDMYSAVSGNVGIGDNTPTYKLDVAGKIGINDTQVLYLPGGNFTGTLIVGTGGGSLEHNSGDQGMYNIGVGIGVLNSNTSGYINTAIGNNALFSNTTGFGSTASGHRALYNNTTGDLNMASGADALFSNTEGSANTASGHGALYSNTEGSANTASGDRALFSNTTGYYNTGIGIASNYYNQAGSNNTIIGYEAGKGSSAHDKSGNIFIGYQAGFNETEDNKLYIENSNSSTPLIGGDFASDEIYLNGNVGIGTEDPSAKCEILADCAWDAGTESGLKVKSSDGTNHDYVYLNASSSHYATLQAYQQLEGPNDLLIQPGGGNVGIGTTSPNSKLDVSGTAEMTGFKLTTSPTTGYVLTSDASGVGTWQELAAISTDGDWTISGSDMYSAVSGNVGIGTTSPGEKLEVNGTSLFSGNMRINGNVGLNADPLITSNNTLYLYDGDTFSEPRIHISGHNEAKIYLESRRVSTTSGNKWIIQSGGGAETYLDMFIISNPDDGGCFFIRDGGKVGIKEMWPKNRLDVNGAMAVGATYSGTNTAPADGMIIEGNVGIGTSSPGATLDVNGSTGYNQVRMRTSYTPSSTSDTNGNTGDVAWDDGYIYIKTSAGWKRSALSTF